MLIDVSKALIIEKFECKYTALDLTENYKTFQLNIDGVNRQNCSFDFYGNNTIYFNYNFQKIHSSSKEYPDLELPANYDEPDRDKPEFKYALAVDFVNKKVYAVSVDNRYESDKLIVLDMQGNNYGIVISNLDLPKHLALDPEVGLIFISQLSSVNNNYILTCFQLTYHSNLSCF